MTVAFIAIFGLVIGSFLAMLVYRIPKNMPVVFARSRCENCNKELKIIHNIPLVSFIFLGGKCAYCKQKISFNNFLIEILTAILFIGLYYKLGLTNHFLFTALAFSMLLALSFIDFKTMLAPDSLNFLALLFALIGAYFCGTEVFIENISASLMIAGTFALLRLFIGYIKKEEALGEADIIVVATLGAILGVFDAYKALFFGCVVALPIAIYLKYKQINRLAFIPFLSIGGLIAVATK